MRNKPEILNELEADELIYKLLASKIGSVDPENVFFAKLMDSGPNAGKYSATIGGKKITANQLNNLVQEAMMLERTQIWKLFTETTKHAADNSMFRASKTFEDMHYGKALLHAISLLETIVKSIQHAHVDEAPKPMGNLSTNKS